MHRCDSYTAYHRPWLEGGYAFTMGCRKGYHFTIALWYINGRLDRPVGICHTDRLRIILPWGDTKVFNLRSSIIARYLWANFGELGQLQAFLIRTAR